ncbi:hypothetical protein ACQPXH_11525 [Nocardia sp. CA-135953]|uniref:hypothetical protein n=1 Tax=Nocardia sp. CA-135953 TaxID=3239978 RepID=UPI003D97EE3C
MPKKVFVYTELQLSVPFDQVPWRQMNPTLLAQPGLVRKTWLSGIGTNTPGGFYEFDGYDNARHFADVYFPTEAAAMSASFQTKLFDGDIVEEASRQMRSPHYDI